MGIKNKKDYVLKIKEFPIWKLINLAHMIEHRLFEAVGQGTSSKKRFMQNLRYKRNIIREVLLDRLILWKKGELKDGIQFSDTNENLNELELI